MEKHCGWRGPLALAALATIFVVGCGQNDQDQVSQDSGTSPGPVVVPTSATAGHSAGTGGIADPVGGGRQDSGTDEVAFAAGSLPPDVTASANDTLAMPGDVIQITARGSADVMEMTLWDGIGDKQLLAHDAGAKVWRADYRVPLRAPAERLGLSVTAKNGANRWRRVWIFVNVVREEEQQEPDRMP